METVFINLENYKEKFMIKIEFNSLIETGEIFMIENICRCCLFINENYQKNYLFEKVKLKRLYKKNEFIN